MQSGMVNWSLTKFQFRRANSFVPVFSLISQSTWNSAGRMRWQLSVCFLRHHQQNTTSYKLQPTETAR